MFFRIVLADWAVGEATLFQQIRPMKTGGSCRISLLK